MFITLLISLIAMVGVTLAADSILQSLDFLGLSDLSSSSLDFIINAFKSNVKAGLSLLG